MKLFLTEENIFNTYYQQFTMHFVKTIACLLTCSNDSVYQNQFKYFWLLYIIS